MMNDPQVLAVYYRFEAGEGVDYTPPEGPLTAQLADFDLIIEGTRVTLVPRMDLRTREEARRVTDPLMRTWAVEAALHLGLRGIRFSYDGAKIVDRHPTAGSAVVDDTAVMLDTVRASVRRSLKAHPPAPSDQFVLTADVESAWNRYRGYLEGREPLLAMSYFVYTLVASGGGGWRGAAVRLNVEESVLKKLSELSSTRGDARSARKIQQNLRPLTTVEKAWLRDAVPKLILQMGASQSSSPMARLEMKDLPRL